VTGSRPSWLCLSREAYEYVASLENGQNEGVPVRWRLRGSVLTLSVCGVVTNHEVELAMKDALANAPSQSGIRLLWDARETLTPMTTEDVRWRFELVSALAQRGILTRACVLFRSEQQQIAALVRPQFALAIPGIPCEAFTDATEAAAWLES
jgi:hypothetical protein